MRLNSIKLIWLNSFPEINQTEDIQFIETGIEARLFDECRIDLLGFISFLRFNSH